MPNARTSPRRKGFFCQQPSSSHLHTRQGNFTGRQFGTFTGLMSHPKVIGLILKARILRLHMRTICQSGVTGLETLGTFY